MKFVQTKEKRAINTVTDAIIKISVDQEVLVVSNKTLSSGDALPWSPKHAPLQWKESSSSSKPKNPTHNS